MHAGWKKYVLWFLLGGTLTVMVGSVAEHYGPLVAGDFLAFASML